MLQAQPQRRELFERRRYRRYKAGDGALVVIPTASDRLYGFLLDISKDGISFEYIPAETRLPEVNKLELLLEDTDTRFTGISFKSVSDIEIQSEGYSPVTMRRHCARFESLTAVQIATLKQFIRNAILPAPR